jgi:hypothetical protein
MFFIEPTIHLIFWRQYLRLTVARMLEKRDFKKIQSSTLESIFLGRSYAADKLARLRNQFFRLNIRIFHTAIQKAFIISPSSNG